MSTTVQALLVIGVVSAGAMGGVFLAFSTFVMRGLGRASDAQGLAAMQGVNQAAPTPLFMVPLLGTALLGVGLAAWAVLHLDDPGAGLVLAGGAIYLVSIGLTAAFHVPRNDALDRLDPADPAAAPAWRTYLRVWTLANHGRTVSGLATAACWVLALRSGVAG